MSVYNDIAWENIQKDVNFIRRQMRDMRVDSLAVIGLSLRLDQKRNGAERTPTNPMDPETEWQKR